MRSIVSRMSAAPRRRRMDNFDQVARDRIVLEDDEMPALLQAAVAIANGHLPVLRRDVMKDAGRDHQIEFCLRPEFIHGYKAASRVAPACDRKTFSRRIATDDLGFRKDLAQVRHATTNSAAKIEDRTDGASQLPRQFDFVASKLPLSTSKKFVCSARIASYCPAY